MSPGNVYFEIVIVKARCFIFGLANISARYRFIICDDNLAHSMYRLCGFFISAKTENLNLVAEAVHHVLQGRCYIGIDFSDLYSAASGQTSASACSSSIRQLNLLGGAVVINKIASGGVVIDHVICGLKTLADRGFDGGLWLIELLTREDADEFSLAGVGEIITAVRLAEPLRDLVVTSATDASCSSIILFAFSTRRFGKG